MFPFFSFYTSNFFEISEKHETLYVRKMERDHICICDKTPASLVLSILIIVPNEGNMQDSLYSCPADHTTARSKVRSSQTV